MIRGPIAANQPHGPDRRLRPAAPQAGGSTTSRPVVSGARLADRRAHYFMDQQIGLHGTIVSIALAVAGLAAASLFDVRAADRPYHALLWVLWISCSWPSESSTPA